MLNSIGQQRLYEFLDAVDTPTAARFRNWVGSVPENEIKAAADSLNKARHGTEFAHWWHARDTISDVQPAPPTPHSRGRTPLEHLHSQARARAANNDFTFGALWLFGGLAVTVGSYSLAASSPYGGSYVIAGGAILYGAMRVLRGLLAR
jgi:hypothetical protein